MVQDQPVHLVLAANTPNTQERLTALLVYLLRALFFTLLVYSITCVFAACKYCQHVMSVLIVYAARTFNQPDTRICCTHMYAKGHFLGTLVIF